MGRLSQWVVVGWTIGAGVGVSNRVYVLDFVVGRVKMGGSVQLLANLESLEMVPYLAGYGGGGQLQSL